MSRVLLYLFNPYYFCTNKDRTLIHHIEQNDILVKNMEKQQFIICTNIKFEFTKVCLEYI
jgi:hypothetical protein